MRLLFFTALLCCSVASYAQKTLPTDYFERLRFSTNVPANPEDEAAVTAMARQLSDSLQQVTIPALHDYTITDSLQRNAAYLYGFIIALFRQDYETAAKYYPLTQPRQAQPTAANRIFALLLADIAVHQQSGNPDEAIRKSIHQTISRIQPDFRKDATNMLKGAYQGYTDILKKTIRASLQEVSKAGNTISYGDAATLMQNLMLLKFLQQHQPAVEAALYAIDPARVKEMDAAIPMRDGVKLHALVYYNANDTTRVPAVISQSPYPMGGEATRGNIFATNGYAYVYVDCRGRRSSEGSYFPYEQDASDFYDIIDWASKQPWCNGQVVTSGGSYLGFAQWQAARKAFRHPALKAINPMASVGFGVDFPRWNNIFYSYILRWATFVSGKDLNTPLFFNSNFWNSVFLRYYNSHSPFVKLDSIAGLPNPFFQKWVAHPDFDQYWRGILPNENDYATLDIPVLTLTGYYDDDQNGAMYYYQHHLHYGGKQAADNHYLLIGPYDHGGSQWNPGPVQNGLPIETAAQIPLYKEVIRWFDWKVKGRQRPAFFDNHIRYFVTGENRWASAQSIAAITKDSIQLYLSPAAITGEKRPMLSLQQQKPAGKAAISYSHNITSVKDSASLLQTHAPGSDAGYMKDDQNLVFESAPLPNDITVSNRFTADLLLRLNVPDADFTVTFYEVTPEGKSYEIGASTLRTRYRNGGEKPQLMQPGKPAWCSFNSAFVYIKKIKKDSRIRMVFSSTNTPFFEKNYGFGGVVSQESTTKDRMIKADLLPGSKITIPVL